MADKLLTIRIDARLAVDYTVAYERALGREKTAGQSVADFIAAFVEDRLAEELEFVQEEFARERK